MNRKEEISKGCGKLSREGNLGFCCGDGVLEKHFCKTCQARLDERIRAEQDFLKDEIEFLEFITKHSLCMCDDIQSVSEERLSKLKSTIKQETKE
jgi:hypothetical protein